MQNNDITVQEVGTKIAFKDFMNLSISERKNLFKKPGATQRLQWQVKNSLKLH